MTELAGSGFESLGRGPAIQRRMAVDLAVRLRDGDHCRICSGRVDWRVRKGARAARVARVHMRDSGPDAFIVAHSGCVAEFTCLAPMAPPARPWLSARSFKQLQHLARRTAQHEAPSDAAVHADIAGRRAVREVWDATVRRRGVVVTRYAADGRVIDERFVRREKVPPGVLLDLEDGSGVGVTVELVQGHGPEISRDQGGGAAVGDRQFVFNATNSEQQLVRDLLNGVPVDGTVTLVQEGSDLVLRIKGVGVADLAEAEGERGTSVGIAHEMSSTGDGDGVGSPAPSRTNVEADGDTSGVSSPQPVTVLDPPPSRVAACAGAGPLNRHQNLVAAAVRLRDGDNCRYCGGAVSWRRGKLRRPILQELDRNAGESPDNYVVTHLGCAKAKGEGLLDAPRRPDLSATSRAQITDLLAGAVSG